MASRVLRRRSAAAAWIYAAVAFGILGTVVAARLLGLQEFGVFATTLAAVGFFQVLLDLTVEESLTKYGFRYVAAEDWGRLRRLFRQTVLLKLVGGALATLILFALAPFADEIFGADGVTQALFAASLLPLVQSTENVGATALLLHSRYDLRGVYQAGADGAAPPRDRDRGSARRHPDDDRARGRAGDRDAGDLGRGCLGSAPLPVRASA